MSTALLKKAVKSGIRSAATAFNNTFGVAITPEGHIISTPRNMNPGTYMGIMRGTYERAELSLLKQFDAASTVVELGANIGIVSSAAIDKLDGLEHLICVEPNPDSLESLRKNVTRARNRQAPFMQPNITFVEAAIGTKESSTRFIRRAGLDSGLVGQVSHRETDSCNTVHVPVSSLSQVLAENRVDGNYSLICDIEGGEIPLMFEDADALDYCVNMLIELHPTSLTGSDIDQNAMLERLQELGFQPRLNIANTYLLERNFS